MDNNNNNLITITERGTKRARESSWSLLMLMLLYNKVLSKLEYRYKSIGNGLYRFVMTLPLIVCNKAFSAAINIYYLYKIVR